MKSVYYFLYKLFKRVPHKDALHAAMVTRRASSNSLVVREHLLGTSIKDSAKKLQRSEKRVKQVLNDYYKFLKENNMTRLEANTEILNTLKDIVERHPELRFEQMLTCLGVESSFYVESEITLKHIEMYKKELGL